MLRYGHVYPRRAGGDLKQGESPVMGLVWYLTLCVFLFTYTLDQWRKRDD